MQRFMRHDRKTPARPSFQTYLEMKGPVDARSLNEAVDSEMLRSLLRPGPVRVLDVGTGTGAMVRRCIGAWDKAASPGSSLELTGVDVDPRSLNVARRKSQDLVASLGYRVTQSDGEVQAMRADRLVRVRFAEADALSLTSLEQTFDLVSAHAVLDLLPLGPGLRSIRQVLVPGGGLYATLNYDGLTSFSPPSSDAVFESRLLQWYNETMDRREVCGERTGGSRCGTLMVEVAVQTGFRVVRVGPSDWRVVPEGGSYRPTEPQFLRALVWMVYAEGQTLPDPCSRRLDRWLSERLAQIEDSELELHVRQTDMFAVAT